MTFTFYTEDEVKEWLDKDFRYLVAFGNAVRNNNACDTVNAEGYIESGNDTKLSVLALFTLNHLTNHDKIVWNNKKNEGVVNAENQSKEAFITNLTEKLRAAYRICGIEMPESIRRWQETRIVKFFVKAIILITTLFLLFEVAWCAIQVFVGIPLDLGTFGIFLKPLTSSLSIGFLAWLQQAWAPLAFITGQMTLAGLLSYIGKNYFYKIPLLGRVFKYFDNLIPHSRFATIVINSILLFGLNILAFFFCPPLMFGLTGLWFRMILKNINRSSSATVVPKPSAMMNNAEAKMSNPKVAFTGNNLDVILDALVVTACLPENESTKNQKQSAKKEIQKKLLSGIRQSQDGTESERNNIVHKLAWYATQEYGKTKGQQIIKLLSGIDAEFFVATVSGARKISITQGYFQRSENIKFLAREIVHSHQTSFEPRSSCLIGWVALSEQLGPVLEQAITEKNLRSLQQQLKLSTPQNLEIKASNHMPSREQMSFFSDVLNLVDTFAIHARDERKKLSKAIESLCIADDLDVNIIIANNFKAVFGRLDSVTQVKRIKQFQKLAKRICDNKAMKLNPEALTIWQQIATSALHIEAKQADVLTPGGSSRAFPPSPSVSGFNATTKTFNPLSPRLASVSANTASTLTSVASTSESMRLTTT